MYTGIKVQQNPCGHGVTVNTSTYKCILFSSPQKSKILPQRFANYEFKGYAFLILHHAFIVTNCCGVFQNSFHYHSKRTSLTFNNIRLNRHIDGRFSRLDKPYEVNFRYKYTFGLLKVAVGVSNLYAVRIYPL